MEVRRGARILHGAAAGRGQHPLFPHGQEPVGLGTEYRAAQLWSVTADDMSGPLLADDQRVYAVTGSGSTHALRAFALATGQEQWSRGADAQVAFVHAGVVYLDGKQLTALEATTGKPLWSTKGLGSARLVSGGRIFLTSPTMSYFGKNNVDQGYFSAVDAKTGTLTPSK